MNFDSTDRRVALVTGASRGLGLEVSRQLLELGFNVLIATRAHSAEAERLTLRYPDRALVIQLDVDSSDSVSRVGRHVASTFGVLDVLVNNAAIHYDTWQSASKADLSVVSQALNTNLLGAWRTVKELSPMMGVRRHGVVVNVSSGAGAIESIGPNAPAYSVSKAALNALTVALASELKALNIIVNAVCPGWVATDMGGVAGRPVEEGAAGIVWAATLPSNGPTGGFFRDGKRLHWTKG